MERGTRGAHGSEPLVPVLEIAEPEPNREGVSRLQLRLRFQNCRFWFRFQTGGFPTVLFRVFTVPNRRYFAVPAWFHGFPVVLHGSDLEPS